MKRVSEKHNVSLENVDRIINFQFAEVKNALQTTANIDITGFARFTINQTKVKNMSLKFVELIDKIHKELEQPDLPEQRRKKLHEKLAIYTDGLEYMKSKVREAKPGRGPTKAKLKKLEEQRLREQGSTEEVI